MLAKNKFKGGRLDDFLAQGEAEAKYGPGRYYQINEDLREQAKDKDRLERKREFSLKIYEALKVQLLLDHAFLSLMGLAVMWAAFDLTAVRSFGLGAALGAFYLVLSQRSADSFNAASIEDVKSGPPSPVVPVLLVLIVGKNPETFAFLPALAGFIVERLATIAQAAYPNDFGLSEADLATEAAEAQAQA